MTAPTALLRPAAWLAAACLVAAPVASGYAASPPRQPGPAARAGDNACPGSYDVTRSTGLKTRSGVRWGTSYLKLRTSTDQKAFCGKVVLKKRFRTKQTVVTYAALNFAADGQKLGELSGQMFGSHLISARFYGNGFTAGEYVTYRVTASWRGRHAKARTLRVALP